MATCTFDREEGWITHRYCFDTYMMCSVTIHLDSTHPRGSSILKPVSYTLLHYPALRRRRREVAVLVGSRAPPSALQALLTLFASYAYETYSENVIAIVLFTTQRRCYWCVHLLLAAAAETRPPRDIFQPHLNFQSRLLHPNTSMKDFDAVSTRY
jgi:hypothetical protein